MHVVWISFTNEKDLPDTALNWKKESPYKTLNDDLKQSPIIQEESVSHTTGRELHKTYS